MISTMLSYTFSHILPMISTTYDIGYDFGYDIPFDINNFLYHSPLISEFSDIMPEFACFRSCYHGTCTTGWRCLRPPRACCSTSSCLPIADVLGTGVQLNGDCLDPAHGLVAKAAARIVTGCRLVVVEKGRLAAAVAAGCAAHAGKAPMHRSHWSFKYGLGVQVGFKIN